MADFKECGTCVTLRHQFAAAMAVQVGLDGELSDAVRGSDPERFRFSARAIEVATAPVMIVREAIREREAKAHSTEVSTPLGQWANRGRY